MCWSGLFDVETLAVNGGNGAFPAGEGFFKTKLEGEYHVIAIAGVKRVLFL